MAVPPTVAIWSSLFRLYLILGTIAGVLAISAFIFNLIRKPKTETPAPSRHSKRKHFAVTIALLLMSITVLSTVEIATFNSTSLVTLPSDPAQQPLVIKVIGRQFFWTFVYPNNYTSVGNLTIPIGRTIILNITSMDVFHSFAIQQLDVAKDAIPGRWNTLWLAVPTAGNYTIVCKELCGVGHAFMVGTLTVVSSSIFNSWYAKQGA